MSRTTVARLDSLGVLRLTGADTLSFLQGQLSNDLQALAPAASLLAGLHTPQGRVIALLRLLDGSEQSVLAVLPVELVPKVSAKLAAYILRAKVRIQDASPQLAVYGVDGPDGRDLVVQDREAAPPAGEASSEALWHATDVAAGLPQVYLATSEAFIAQMLNLDHVGGISFTKGCYTGQEIIARAHYRGRVKRRMQRFWTAASVPPRPGERYRLSDARMLEVVDAAPRAGGGYDVLAVAPLQPGAPAEETSAASPPLALLAAEPAPLPYALET